MNTFSMRATLALALTFATLTAVPGAVLAADHGGAHGAASTQAAEHDSAQIYTATGTINAVDKAAGKATITHDPVPALGWPVMTMGFTFEDASLLDDLKAGDKVRFDFRNQGKTSIIVDIETRK